jgi:hypothetical protein
VGVNTRRIGAHQRAIGAAQLAAAAAVGLREPGAVAAATAFCRSRASAITATVATMCRA